MKQGLLIILLTCTVAAAMVPRARRWEPTDGRNEPQTCAPTTPCGWSIYKTSARIIEMNITNSYCNCAPDKSCRVYEDDTAASAYVLRCMKKDS